MKTVRFTQVVARCGAPELHPLWTAPEDDAQFQRAVKAGRVMTLEQVNVGSRRDRGVIGYAPGEHAQFLIFPKSLKPFAGREVVGVKYELLREPAVKEPYHAPAAKARKPARPELQVKIVDNEPATERHERDGEGAASATANSASRAKGRGGAARARADAADNVVAFEHARAARTERAPARTQRGEGDAAHAPKQPNAERRLAALLAEVKRGLKELKQGKAVAAYERLTKAVRAAEAK